MPKARPVTQSMHRFSWTALFILAIGLVVWGYSIAHYPSSYVDESFFIFPAYKASIGQPFAYVVNSAAPYARSVWAYHGPLYPHLLSVLFRVFGFSRRIARLPNLICGWLAPALLVWFLSRRGYRKAGLILAVLWLGDRATQELLYARMDGIALFFLTAMFVFLVRILEKPKPIECLLAGLLCGLAGLTNPACLSVAILVLVLFLVLRTYQALLLFFAGLAANLPILLWLLNWRYREALEQFRWHAHRLQGESAIHSVMLMFKVLRWSRYWCLALILFALWSIGRSLWRLIRERTIEPGIETDLFASSVMMAATLPLLFRSSTHPYYLVYFSLWPMLSMAILVDKRWREVRVAAIALGLIWCSSMAWNALRLREAIRYRKQLENHTLSDRVIRDIPADRELIVSPMLYWVPMEANHGNFELTSWFAEDQDACAECYVLLSKAEYDSVPGYISRRNLSRRRLLFDIQAFPGAKQMEDEVLLLSPEVAP